MPNSIVKRFQDVDKSQTEQVGALGAQLGELTRAGIPLPRGFIITSGAYQTFFHKSGAGEILRNIKAEDLRQTTVRVKGLLAKKEIPQEVSGQILKEYKKLGSLLGKSTVKITTSDKNASAYLKARGDKKLLAAIKDIWISEVSPNTLMSQEAGPEGALVITEVISPDVSGVAATAGLGEEKVYKHKIIIKVNTNTSPDYYEVERHSLEILTKKTKKRKTNLEDKQILTLAGILQKIHAFYYFPQEVKWAFKNGKFYILDVSEATPNQKARQLPKEDKVNLPVSHSLKTATKIMGYHKNESGGNNAHQPFDGLGFFDVTEIITRLGAHPKHLKAQSKHHALSKSIEATLEDLLASYDPRPVFYKISDPTSGQYRTLDGGAAYEPLETNPFLGFRGADRHISDPETFILELNAIKNARQDHRNLNICLSFVRTPAELLQVKRIMAGENLIRSGSLKIWLTIQLPVNVILIEDFIKVGVDGVLVDLDTLQALTTGSEGNKEEVKGDHKALLWSVERVLEMAQKYNIPTGAYGDLINSDELLTHLVKKGIGSIFVRNEALGRIQNLVWEIERKII